VKRFMADQPGRKVMFITEHADSFMERAVTDKYPIVELSFAKSKSGKSKEKEQINLSEFIAVKGVKALGNRLATQKVKNIEFLDPLEDDTDYDALQTPVEKGLAEEEEIEDSDASTDVSSDALAKEEVIEDGEGESSQESTAIQEEDVSAEATAKVEVSAEVEVETPEKAPKAKDKKAKPILKKSKEGDDESQIKLDL